MWRIALRAAVVGHVAVIAYAIRQLETVAPDVALALALGLFLGVVTMIGIVEFARRA